MNETSSISNFILKPKVLLGVYAVAFVLFITLTKATVDVVEKVEQDIIKVNKQRASYSKKYIEAHLVETMSEIEVSIYALISFIDTLNDGNDVGEIIEDMVNKFPRINNLLLFDINGQSKYFPANLNTINVADRDYFIFHKENPLSGLYMSVPFVGRMKNQLIFTLSMTKLTDEGEFDGVYLAAINPVVFAEIYRYLESEGFGVAIRSTRNGALYYGDENPVIDDDEFYRDFTVKEFPITITVFGKEEGKSLFSYTIKLLEKMKAYLVYWGMFSVFFGGFFIFSLKRQFDLSKQYMFASSHDYLTGTLNRRAFMTVLNRESYRAKRYKNSLALIMVDIDHFKQVNDQYGHANGDKAIIHLSDLIGQHIRDSDYLARIGGEEFVILLPETDLAGAIVSAEKIRKKLTESSVILNNKLVTIKASFGVSDLHSILPHSGTIATLSADLLECADKQLYKAKETRNCVAPKI